MPLQAVTESCFDLPELARRSSDYTAVKKFHAFKDLLKTDPMPSWDIKWDRSDIFPTALTPSYLGETL